MKAMGIRKAIINVNAIYRGVAAMVVVVFCIGSGVTNALETVTSHHDEFTPLTNKYFSDHARGWHWYEDPVEEEKQKKSEPKSKTTESDKPPEIQELENIQKHLKELREIAIINPTHENVEKYMKLQYREMERAQKFADVWKQVLYATPELDLSLKNPSRQLASLVKVDETKKENDRALASISEHYGLFFFFRGECPYCHKFAPILKRFATNYGIKVIPISLDGGNLPDYQRPRFDTQHVVAQQFNVRSVPSLFLVDPQNRNVIPVTQGLIGTADLVERIIKLTRQDALQDYEKQPFVNGDSINLDL